MDDSIGSGTRAQMKQVRAIRASNQGIAGVHFDERRFVDKNVMTGFNNTELNHERTMSFKENSASFSFRSMQRMTATPAIYGVR